MKKVPAVGLYDSGSNISLINYKFWKENFSKQKIISGGKNIKGISGQVQAENSVCLKVNIGKLEKDFPFFVLKSENFGEDLLLGLDAIQKFRLCQDEKYDNFSKDFLATSSEGKR